MNTRTSLLTILLLMLWTSTVWGESTCADCVEDVVVETRDGQWLSGYIFWNRSPFRFLDLSRQQSRLVLERGSGSTGTIRLWLHAVSLSRQRFPPDLGELPAVPDPMTQWYSRRDHEVALLVGEPTEILIGSMRRIYPRLGSGLPAIRVSDEQLAQLADLHLPFHVRRAPAECMGCPMTVEDATILLKSGEWVSGLVPWHAATAVLRGYDYREGADPPISGFGLSGWQTDEVVLWTDAVSAPRRKFESAASTDDPAKLVRRRGFFRVGPAVFVVGSPRVVPISEITLILPGPSTARYPLQIQRADALRLLLEQPSLAAVFLNDPVELNCFGYGPEVTFEDLAKVCDSEAISASGDESGAIHPQHLVVRAPGSLRRVPVLEDDATLITLFFDSGT